MLPKNRALWGRVFEDWWDVVIIAFLVMFCIRLQYFNIIGNPVGVTRGKPGVCGPTQRGSEAKETSERERQIVGTMLKSITNTRGQKTWLRFTSSLHLRIQMGLKCENLLQNAFKLMQTTYISTLKNVLIHLNVIT